MANQDIILSTSLIVSNDSGSLLYLTVKRVADVVIALSVLVLLLPLFVVIGLCIRLDSPGPILFRQTRMGHERRRLNRRARPRSAASAPAERRTGTDRRIRDMGARLFTVYKFRTMYHNADPEIHRQYVRRLIKNQISHQAGAPVSAALYKLGEDPRITRVGRFLRRTSLDEFPQLINVLRGEMSLVGPRPALPYEALEYHEWHKARLKTMPGMTGLWQVQGRSLVPFDQMVKMDIYYANHQSLALDLKILLLTPWAALSGKGAR